MEKKSIERLVGRIKIRYSRILCIFPTQTVLKFPISCANTRYLPRARSRFDKFISSPLSETWPQIRSSRGAQQQSIWFSDKFVCNFPARTFSTMREIPASRGRVRVSRNLFSLSPETKRKSSFADSTWIYADWLCLDLNANLPRGRLRQVQAWCMRQERKSHDRGTHVCAMREDEVTARWNTIDIPSSRSRDAIECIFQDCTTDLILRDAPAVEAADWFHI